jgi:hypothetical protein
MIVLEGKPSWFRVSLRSFNTTAAQRFGSIEIGPNLVPALRSTARGEGKVERGVPRA